MGDDLTFQQILAMLEGKYSQQKGGGVMSGVGSRGLDTPAERDFLQKYGGTEESTDRGLMDAAVAKPIDVMRRDYDFDVDGKTEGYTFTGDGLSSDAIQRMRDLQGITADGDLIKNLGIGDRSLGTDAEKMKLAAIMGMGAQPEQMKRFMETNIVPENYLQKYGVGARGLDTPAERDSLAAAMGGGATHTMPDGTVMPGATHGEYNNMGGMSTAAGQGGVDRQRFNEQFNALDDRQKASVTEIMAGMTPAQKDMFARGLTNSPLGGYEVQNQNRLAY